MPAFERLVDRKLYKLYELKKTLDDIDLTLHKGAYEKGREDVYYSSDEDE